MGNWGEEVDYEAQDLKEYKGRFTINFKKINMDLIEINERTLEINDKHPKDALLLAWAGNMVGMLIFMLLAYKVFIFVALPILAFYVFVLFKIASTWKRFHYNLVQYWLMTVGALLVCAGLTVAAHYLIGILRR